MATYFNQVFVSVPKCDIHESSPVYFTCIQEGLIVRGTYTGENIQCGTLVGMIGSEGELHFQYHHINDKNELRSGIGRLKPELLSDGRLKLVGTWQGIEGIQQEAMLCHSFDGADHLDYMSV